MSNYYTLSFFIFRHPRCSHYREKSRVIVETCLRLHNCLAGMMIPLWTMSKRNQIEKKEKWWNDCAALLLGHGHDWCRCRSANNLALDILKEEKVSENTIFCMGDDGMKTSAESFHILTPEYWLNYLFTLHTMNLEHSIWNATAT